MSQEIPAQLFGLNRASFTVDPSQPIALELAKRYRDSSIDFVRDNAPYGATDYFLLEGEGGDINLSRAADWLEVLAQHGIRGMLTLLDRICPRTEGSMIADPPIPPARGIES